MADPQKPAPTKSPGRKAAPTRASARRPVPYAGEANRRAILEAALQVFSALGFEGASTRAIAAAAGIEQGHLAYYFPSKEALWREVIETFAREAEGLVRHAVTPESLARPLETARMLLPRFLGIFADQPRMTRLMLQEFSLTSPRHNWLVENFGRPVWLHIRPLFEALRELGLLSGAPAEVAYFNLVAGAMIVFGNADVLRTIAGIDPAREAFRAQTIEYLLSPVFHH